MSIPSWAPGGQIPPGVLDPTINSLLPPRRTRHDVLASTQGSLAIATRRFMATQHRRHVRPLHSFHYDGIAGERPHDLFVPELLINVEITMVDLDQIQERILQEFALRTPRDQEQPYEIEEKLKERTPQFFLRNVQRVERDINPHRPPYHLEIYLDEELLQRIGTHDYVANFTLERPDAFEARRHVNDWWRSRIDLFFKLDWEETQSTNAWRSRDEEIPIRALYIPEGIKRLRGRFATPAEAKAEARAAAKARRRSKVLSEDELLDAINARSFDGRIQDDDDD